MTDEELDLSRQLSELYASERDRRASAQKAMVRLRRDLDRCQAELAQVQQQLADSRRERRRVDLVLGEALVLGPAARQHILDYLQGTLAGAAPPETLAELVDRFRTLLEEVEQRADARVELLRERVQTTVTQLTQLVNAVTPTATTWNFPAALNPVNVHAQLQRRLEELTA